MSRFVRPNTRTLTLGNGDQLIVRERLTAGEQRAHYARRYTHDATGRLVVNPLTVGDGIVLAYLLDWNLRDDQGNAVLIRDLATDDLQRVVDSLDTESFQEIRSAIEAHETAMTTAREAEKKTDGGTPS
jgi:hypothetical protein